MTDCHRLHQTLMQLLPDGINTADGVGARGQYDLLYRVDDDRANPQIIMQGSFKPDLYKLDKNDRSSEPYLQSSYLGPGEIKLIKDGAEGYYSRLLQPGAILDFIIRANPTSAKKNPAKGRSIAVPLTRASDQLDWLCSRFAKAGLRVVDPDQVEISQRVLRSHKGITLTTFLARGQVEVASRGKVYADGKEADVPSRESIERLLYLGLGKGRAFGCGLLSLLPSN